jgi:hypothetical protein
MDDARFHRLTGTEPRACYLRQDLTEALLHVVDDSIGDNARVTVP